MVHQKTNTLRYVSNSPLCYTNDLKHPLIIVSANGRKVMPYNAMAKNCKIQNKMATPPCDHKNTRRNAITTQNKRVTMAIILIMVEVNLPRSKRPNT